MNASKMLPESHQTTYLNFRNRSFRIVGGTMIVLDSPPNGHHICGDSEECLWPISAQDAATALEPFMEKLTEEERVELHDALNPKAHVPMTLDECWT